MRGDRIRLLKFINLFAIGGTERQFVNVVQRLDPELFDIHLSCFRKYGEFLSEIEACGHPLTEYSINRLFGRRTFREQLRFASYLRAQRIQVVHTYGFYPNLFGIPAARMAGVPVRIAAIRDTGAHLSSTHKTLQRIACGMANCILVNAAAVKQWLVGQGYAENKIRVIPNGIVSRPAEGAPTLRQQCGLPSDAALVGVMCRLSPVKGLNYFIDAAAALASRHVDARFLIIGDGQEKETLRAQVQRLGLESKIVFTGFRTDTSEVLPQLSVSVLPSLTEGMSNTLLESMAAGVPVVATRVGGNPEIVVDGHTGLLTPAQDPAALAEAISKLLANPVLARQMGAAGKDRIAKHFSVEQTIQQTQVLYNEMLEGVAA